METGQRIFIRIDGQPYLLGVPSAFEIGLNHCRWIYKHKNHCFQVRTWTSKKAPQVNMDFKVISGKNVNLIITQHFDPANGWTNTSEKATGEFLFTPEKESMIAGKFPHARYRLIIHNFNPEINTKFNEDCKINNSENSILFIEVPDTSNFCMSFVGEVCTVTKPIKIENADIQWAFDCQEAQTNLKELCLNLTLIGDQKDVSAIREILPWYSMNALTHFLTPYGLEQFSGAAWGTRDVSQGPIELLLCMEKYEEAKQVLCIIFSHQNQDGGWPQWWMFDSYHTIRANESHGDIVYWCIIALSKYINVTGDLEILNKILPYYHEKGIVYAEKTPIGEHVDRLITSIVRSFIKGTAFVPFGGGDWNDSLQPVSKQLAQNLISSWTVEMNFQAFMQYALIYKKLGNINKFTELNNICERIKNDFNQYLIKDGVVAGYGLVQEDGSIGVLLHPRDTQTNIQYSLLPMNRGIISGIFTKDQARFHQDIIEKYLKGPDGARLMNRPLRYKGGIQTIFKRAESSTFFGREIGLMYVHEHLRYAESLAITGDADAFIKALRQAIPVAYQEVVPCGDVVRQIVIIVALMLASRVVMMQMNDMMRLYQERSLLKEVGEYIPADLDYMWD